MPPFYEKTFSRICILPGPTGTYIIIAPDALNYYLHIQTNGLNKSVVGRTLEYPYNIMYIQYTVEILSGSDSSVTMRYDKSF